MSQDFKFELAHDHSTWQHSHNFAFGHEVESERRTFWVMVLTAFMTVAEVAAGYFYNSFALFADGWHMSTHAVALAMGYFAYRYARLQARNEAYSFGTGKVHALGSYSSALVLSFVALFVLGDSIWGLFQTHAISYDQAIPVAFVGLIVNLMSVKMLHMGGDHSGHDHGHDHEGHDHAKGHEHDHNMKAAYAHVVVDAMTSVLAIGSLFVGKYLHWTILDPIVGIVGAVIIGQWAWSLMKTALTLLLDRRPSSELANGIRSKIESDGDSQIADFHLWQVAPGRTAAIVSVISHQPRSADEYKGRLKGLDLAHITIETNICAR